MFTEVALVHLIVMLVTVAFGGSSSVKVISESVFSLPRPADVNAVTLTL